MSTKKTSKAKKTDKALLASRAFAKELARLAQDRHCRDIVIFEVDKISPVARHFIIATGTSDQQIRSVAQEMEKLGKDNHFAPLHHAGMQQGRWIVLDLVDIVVHLFDEEYRKFYDLELLWGDAPRVRWQRTSRKKTE